MKKKPSEIFEGKNSSLYKTFVEVISIDEIDRSTWGKLKAELLLIQTELEERNGLDYCKNCGMDYKVLIEDIEKIFLSTNIKSNGKQIIKGK